MIGASHMEDLRALLGPKGLLTDAQDRAAYETGARYDSGRAAFVARPATTREAAAVLAFCATHAIPVVPQSGNTGVVVGSTPDASGTQAVLSLDRLRETFELDAPNRSLRVSAGFRLSEINERLAPHGLFFPIDLGADPCIGGMAATNTGGARFLRYGDVRRNILGLEVACADGAGSVRRFGRGLRKDNTGADWKQLFIGTCGAFGVVTECTLNLEHRPQQSATAYLVPAAEAAVPALLDLLERQAGSELSAFECMSGTSIRHTLDHAPSLGNPFPGGAVPDLVILVELTRSWPMREGETALDDVLGLVLAEAFDDGAALLENAFVGPPEAMWALRHALSEGVKAAGDLVAFDLSFRRGEVMAFRAAMRKLLTERFPMAEICDFGHVGDGGVHFNLVLPRGSLADEALVGALRDMVIRTAVEEFNGSFSAEHGLGRRNQPYYDRYASPEDRALAAAFKQLVSPAPLGVARLG